MKTKYVILYLMIVAFVAVIVGCNKNQDNQNQLNLPQQQVSSDKEKELQVKEDLLNQRQKELDEREKTLNARDSALTVKTLETEKGKTADSTKTKKEKDKEKKQTEKEKELNKKLDNPTVAISDYIEFIQRATEGNYDDNIKKAANCWEKPTVDNMKKQYKNVKKIVIVEQPKVVSQKNNKSQVKIKIKMTRNEGGKEKSDDMTLTYSLKADDNGKWKITGKANK